MGQGLTEEQLNQMGAVDVKSSGLSEKELDAMGAQDFDYINPKINPLKQFETFSKFIDPYTAAPLRAGVGTAMEGDLTGAAKSAFEQFLEGRVKKDTPSGEDLTYRGMIKSGIHPEFAKSTSETVGPMVGGMLDVTALPIGPEFLTKGAMGLAKGGHYVLRKALDASEPIGKAAAKALYRSGNVLTQGNIPVGASLKAIDKLNPIQQLIPEAFLSKAGKNLSNARAVAEESGAVTEGSSEAIGEIPKLLKKARGEVLNAPNIGILEKRIRGRLTPVDDIPVSDPTVSEIDTYLRNIDEVHYTPHGNPRAVKSQIKPYTKESRGILTGELAKTPEGRDILDKRETYAALKTSQGGRSKLLTAAGILGAPSTSGASLALNPRVYHFITSVARMPKGLAELGMKVGESVAGFASRIAEKNPKLAEHILRAYALSEGREESDYENTP